MHVTITPTYTGCPAIDTIREDIGDALDGGGLPDVEVDRAVPPRGPPTTHRRGRAKLADAGIAPPGPSPDAGGPVAAGPAVRCPQCGILDTRELSRFGSTACKALWGCRACREPFDQFKVL